MKQITLSAALIPLLGSAIFASGSTPYPVPQPIPQAVPQPIPQKVPKPIPQKTPKPVYQAVPKPIPQAVPKPIPQMVPKPIPQKTPKPVYQAVPQPIPQEVPKPVPQAVPTPIPQKVPKKLTIHKYKKPSKLPKQYHGSKPEVMKHAKKHAKKHPKAHKEKIHHKTLYPVDQVHKAPAVHTAHSTPQKHTPHTVGRTASKRMPNMVGSTVITNINGAPHVTIPIQKNGKEVKILVPVEIRNTKQGNVLLFNGQPFQYLRSVGVKFNGNQATINGKNIGTVGKNHILKLISKPVHTSTSTPSIPKGYHQITVPNTGKGGGSKTIIVPNGLNAPKGQVATGVIPKGSSTQHPSTSHAKTPGVIAKPHAKGGSTATGGTPAIPKGYHQITVQNTGKGGGYKTIVVPNAIKQPKLPAQSNTAPQPKTPAPVNKSNWVYGGAKTKGPAVPQKSQNQVSASLRPTPNKQQTPHVNPQQLQAPAKSVQGTPTVNPAKLQAPAKGPKQVAPMVHPTPSKPGYINGVKQATPMVKPTPSKPGYVQGVKQQTPHINPQQLQAPAKSPSGTPTVNPAKLQAPAKGPKQVAPMVHPTPSKPGYVNGVKQATPMAKPTPSKPGYVQGVKQQTPHVNPQQLQAPAKSPSGTPTVNPAKLQAPAKSVQGTPTVNPGKLQTPAISPQGTPHINPQQLQAPAKSPSGTPTVNPAKLQAPAKSPHGTPTLQPGAVVHNKNGAPIGKVVKLPNGQMGVQPIAVPPVAPIVTGAIPTKQTGQSPAKSVQGTPTVNPSKLQAPAKGPKQVAPMVHPTPSKPGYVNGVKQATPTIHSGNQGGTSATGSTHNAGSTKPGFFDKIKSFLFGPKEGRTDKVIEPGTRNKEAEAYRTHDAKEVMSKDAIIQDDKNVSLPSKHSR